MYARVRCRGCTARAVPMALAVPVGVGGGPQGACLAAPLVQRLGEAAGVWWRACWCGKRALLLLLLLEVGRRRRRPRGLYSYYYLVRVVRCVPDGGATNCVLCLTV